MGVIVLRCSLYGEKEEKKKKKKKKRQRKIFQVRVDFPFRPAPPAPRYQITPPNNFWWAKLGLISSGLSTHPPSTTSTCLKRSVGGARSFVCALCKTPR